MEMYMTKVYYLAHPYRDNIRKNHRKCSKIYIELVKKGYILCCPVIRPKWVNRRMSHEFWYEYDLELVRKCDGIILCPGYIHSYGCMLELQEAFRLNLEILSLEECLENES